MKTCITIALIGAGPAGKGILNTITATDNAGAATKFDTCCNKLRFVCDPLLADKDFQGLKISPDMSGLLPVDVILFAVPDNKIAELSNQLAEFLKKENWVKKPLVLHCSAATPIDVLQTVADLGCCTGVLHPLQTFTSDSLKPKVVNWGFIGSDSAHILSSELLAGRGRMIRVNPDQQTQYHLAGVFASNFLPALMSLLQELWPSSEGNPGTEALLPLIEQTLENLTQFGSAAALSGPLRRKDTTTIKRHLAWLDESNPELAIIYRLLSKRLISLVNSKSGEQNPEVSDISLDAWINLLENTDEINADNCRK
jgi:predicted short-subunit dehydrogenase-like oxidoreductase (DUF2520 family)